MKVILIDTLSNTVSIAIFLFKNKPHFLNVERSFLFKFGFFTLGVEYSINLFKFIFVIFKLDQSGNLISLYFLYAFKRKA